MDRAFPPLAHVVTFLYETPRGAARSFVERPSPLAGLVQALAALPETLPDAHDLLTIERRDKRGRRPLLNAIEANDEDWVVRLLENGAKATPNALTEAIRNKLGERAFRMLLERANARGLDLVNAFDARGSTPLTLAASEGDDDRLQLLLACCPGLDVNQTDKHGNTSLILAAAKGHYGIVYRLLADHADVARENANRCSPLVVTLQFWDDHERVRYCKIFEALLKVLQGMMNDGGEVKDKARAILEAAYQEASAHGQAEQWRIGQILGKG
jgi:ankyrin repeat protein